MTEQEKLDLLNRAAKATRNWGIGFGLMVVEEAEYLHCLETTI